MLRETNAGVGFIQAGAGCHAFVLWFDVTFPAPASDASAIVLSTSPHKPVTHWAQTILTLRCATSDFLSMHVSARAKGFMELW